MKFRKLFATLSSFAIVMGISMCNVSALTAPNSYDINNDGAINISDVVSINMALIGSWKPTNILTLDANQNGIIDNLDSKAIMSYVVMIGIPTITMQ